MRIITLSAADEVNDQARDKACAQVATRHDGSRKSLASYVHAAVGQTADNCFHGAIQALLNVGAGSKINRDKMKECWL
jgi:hypothetical protein